MGKWVDIKEYNPDIHGRYLCVRMNSKKPENIMTVVYMPDGNSSKWWTSYPDGGLRTCGVPDEFFISYHPNTKE